ncbi:MAG: cytochrome b5-like heme/steroid binding domain-containing protein [Patescibacteria group bacterium]|jgi:cytochrome b involved in lipid metabolism
MKSELTIGILGTILIIVLSVLYWNAYETVASDSLLFTNQGINMNIQTIPESSTTSIVLNKETIAKHRTRADCWLLIQDSVYDATSYIDAHPGGADRILAYCGADATSAFLTQGGEGRHSTSAVQDLLGLRIGSLNEVLPGTQATLPNTVVPINTSPVITSPSTNTQTQAVPTTVLDAATVALHRTSSDCWLIISNQVYNATSYISRHPGGANQIIPYCGKDATTAFTTQGGQGSHSSTATNQLTALRIGSLGQSVQTTQPSNVPGVTTLPTQQSSDDREDEDEDD